MSHPPDDTDHPDRRALARIGTQVRTRLDAIAQARRIATDQAEIYALPRFLSARACGRLIAMIDASATPSALAGDAAGADYRTSSSGDFDTADPVVADLETRLSTLTGIALKHGEAVQGQRYKCGEFFREHFDWFDTSAAYWPREARSGGQRSWTAMLYLNAVEQGGTTDFTRLPISIVPQRGMLLLWNNAQPDGRPNPWTMHAARPVERGVKYVVTKWFRTRQWR